MEKRGGVGLKLEGVLLIVFITLKLTGLIDWSWWWVLSPIWIMLAMILLGIIVLEIIFKNK